MPEEWWESRREKHPAMDDENSMLEVWKSKKPGGWDDVGDGHWTLDAGR